MKKIVFNNGEQKSIILIKDNDRAQAQFEAWIGDLLEMVGRVTSPRVDCVIATDMLGEASLTISPATSRSRGRLLDKEVGIIPLWEIDSI